MKKIIVFFLTFAILLSVFAVPAYGFSNPAEDETEEEFWGDFSEDSFGIFTANYNQVSAFKAHLKNIQDYQDGKITGEAFIQRGLEIEGTKIDSDIHAFYNTIKQSVINSAVPLPIRIFAPLINNIRDYLSDNGGSVSDFPIGDDILRYNIPGGGYFTLKTTSESPIGVPYYAVYYTVYYSDGTIAVDNQYAWSTGAVTGKFLENGDGIFNIHLLNYSIIGTTTGDRTRVNFSCMYYDNYPNFRDDGFYLDIPWAIDTGSDFEQVTSTPDVDNLTDDELLKYIGNLIDNLEKTYPDLSTLEGKLQEIINKMDKLGNGCNCAELATAVYALLDFLQHNGGGSTDNTDLVNALYELINTLKHNGNNNVDLSDINTKLDKIYNEIAGIRDDIKNDDDSSEMKNAGTESILKFSEKLQNKFQVGAVKATIDNFSSAVFGKRVFSQDDKSGRIMVASVYADGSRSAYSYFSLPVDFNFFGQSVQVDLAEFCKFIPPGLMSTVKDFISYILWFAFLIGLYRSLPGLLAGVGRVETHNSKLNGG